MNSQRRGDRCFAVRRVNPFDGVLQVLETETARAYSADGATWQVQVRAQRPHHTWRSASDTPSVEQYFNFGRWDERHGLHRVPANPVMDIGRMSAAAERLGESLQSRTGELPFRLIDHFECWSIDRHRRPVALLATTEDQDRIADLDPGHWQASRPDDPGFVSPSSMAPGMRDGGESVAGQYARQLEAQVRRRGRERIWFRRQADGNGVPLTPSETEVTSAARDLPALGLTTDWPDEQTGTLVEDYLTWKAPQLLTLQSIDDELRGRLEREACKQAPRLAAIYRLLPRVIDRELLAAARVEARLRQARPAGA